MACPLRIVRDSSRLRDVAQGAAARQGRIGYAVLQLERAELKGLKERRNVCRDLQAVILPALTAKAVVISTWLGFQLMASCRHQQHACTCITALRQRTYEVLR
jgi:hypothetical protein